MHELFHALNVDMGSWKKNQLRLDWDCQL